MGSRVRRQASNPPPVIYQPYGSRKFLILFCLTFLLVKRMIMIKAPTSGLWWGLNEVIHTQCLEQCGAHKSSTSSRYCFVDGALGPNPLQLWTPTFFLGARPPSPISSYLLQSRQCWAGNRLGLPPWSPAPLVGN